MSNEEKILAQLLHTWQPVAALAFRCDIPVKTCLTELLKMTEKGIVKKTRVRIDGHNKVHLFKKIEYVQVMSQRLPIERAEVEA
jgi:DNA-binding Lrp family transcriptional regulator